MTIIYFSACCLPIFNIKRHTYIPYECCRCGLSTRHKTSMKRHLTERKDTCPAVQANITITDDIVEIILQNRVYKPQGTIISDGTAQSNIIHQTQNIFIIL